MKNNIIQIVWTLYSASLMTVAERHWIIKGTAKLNQPIYFRDVLALEWKFRIENVLCWGKGHDFVSTGIRKLWIPTKLIQTRLDLG